MSDSVTLNESQKRIIELDQVLVLDFHSDSSHGWIESSFYLLDKLNLIDKITPYSYVNLSSHTAYLEEDQDCSLFLDALRNNHISYNIKEVYSNNDRSFIRGLRSFNSDEVNTLTKRGIKN